MMDHGKGFTLIELIMVVAILGIISAVAIPKYINLKDTARHNVFMALKAAISSTAKMAHLKQKLEKKGPNESIEIDGRTIQMQSGYPHDRSIRFLVDYTGFTARSTGWFMWNGKQPVTFQCSLDYNYAGWGGNPTPGIYNITMQEGGC